MHIRAARMHIRAARVDRTHIRAARVDRTHIRAARAGRTHIREARTVKAKTHTVPPMVISSPMAGSREFRIIRSTSIRE